MISLSSSIKSGIYDNYSRGNIGDFLKDKIIIITDGKKGSYAFDNKRYYQKAIKVNSITDATGAGDAYTSGFITHYLQTKDIQISMEKGARYASKILLRMGAN